MSVKTGDQVEAQHDHISLPQGKLWTPLGRSHRAEASSVLPSIRVANWPHALHASGGLCIWDPQVLLDQRGELRYGPPFGLLLDSLFVFLWLCESLW